MTLQHQLRAVGEALAMVLAEPAEKSDHKPSWHCCTSQPP